MENTATTEAPATTLYRLVDGNAKGKNHKTYLCEKARNCQHLSIIIPVTDSKDDAMVMDESTANEFMKKLNTGAYAHWQREPVTD